MMKRYTKLKSPRIEAKNRKVKAIMKESVTCCEMCLWTSSIDPKESPAARPAVKVIKR